MRSVSSSNQHPSQTPPLHHNSHSAEGSETVQIKGSSLPHSVFHSPSLNELQPPPWSADPLRNRWQSSSTSIISTPGPRAPKCPLWSCNMQTTVSSSPTQKRMRKQALPTLNRSSVCTLQERPGPGRPPEDPSCWT